MLYSLGLQSGATDGAVSWGVLERLLEDQDVAIEAVSGASSGSVNTLVLGYGLATGGRGRAQALLENFWFRASQRGGLQSSSVSPAEALFGHGSLAYLPLFWANTAFIQSTSPYLWNPGGLHLIREVMGEVVDFAVLRAQCPIKLFVTATDVQRAEARVFRNHEMTLEVAAASTCLPLYIPAQKIDGCHYWDGGYAGAPKLQPLVDECTADDIILIRISPAERPQVPHTAFSIIERSIELAVAVGVDEELRRLDLISRLIREGRLQPGGGVRKVAVHSIEATDLTRDLPYSSKYNLDWTFLRELRDYGRGLATEWLKTAPHHKHRHAERKAAE